MRLTLVCCILSTLLLLIPFSAVCGTVSPVAPEIVPLGAPLSGAESLDVDQYGRLYVLDRSREAVMRFGGDGKLERLWPEGFGEAASRNNRQELSVSANGIMFLGFGGTNFQDARRIWPEVGEDKTFPVKDMSVLCVAGSSDGSFYIRGIPWGADAPKNSDTIRAFAPDGTERTRWFTPPIGNWTLGNDGLIYGARKDQTWLYDGTPQPKPQPGEESLMLVYTTDGKLDHKIDLSAVLGKSALGYGQSTRFAVDENGGIYLPHGDQVAHLDNHGRLLNWLRIYAGPKSTSAWNAGLKDTAVRNGLVYLLVKLSEPRKAGEQKDTEIAGQIDYRYEIQVLTPDGRCVTRYVPTRPQLDMPSGIAVQSDGSYAVVEQGYKDLMLFGPKGNILGPLASGHYALQAVAARPGGGYYVSSWMSGGMGMDTISADGKTVKEIYRCPEMKYSEMPYRLAVDPRNGDVWGLGEALFHFSPDGVLIHRYPSTKRSYYGGFAVDANGFIYSIDYTHRWVVKQDVEGNEIAKFGSEGTGLGQLRSPQGLLVDAKGNVLVADTGNSRIQVFSSDGKPIGFYGHRGTGSGELDRPETMTFGPNGSLWISDTHNDRIVRLSLRDFWRQLETDPKPEAILAEPKLQQLPSSGKASIAGVVIADSDDFSDLVYLESPDRAWGISATLPDGTRVKRGERWRITGTLSGTRRHIVGEIATPGPKTDAPGPQPLAMANVYVGNGFLPLGRPAGLTNQSMLIRTWGKVTSVDAEKQSFTIDDGSLEGGLEVSTRGLRWVVSTLPRVGQYVCVTGISAASDRGPCVRVRGPEDIRTVAEEQSSPDVTK